MRKRTSRKGRAKGYYQKYEDGRNRDSQKLRRRKRNLCRIIRMLAPDGVDSGRLYTAIMCSITRTQMRLSCRGLSTHFAMYATDRKRCRTRFWSKTHINDLELLPGGLLYRHKSLLSDIVTAMAGKNATGSLHGDSSGFARNSYSVWEDAKAGLVSRKGFAKLHLVTFVRGMIAGFEVTEGTVHDSPIFRKIYKRLLNGDGYAILDAAYDAFENCKLIADSGRIPVINPRANSVPKGFNARARMTRWYRDDPEGFARVYGLRNLAVCVLVDQIQAWGDGARQEPCSADSRAVCQSSLLQSDRVK